MNVNFLLSGVAVIVALAVSAPVLAQTSSSPPAPGSATPPMHHQGHHVTHHAVAHHKMAPLTGNTANQLNQQELARIQSGSSMPPPARWARSRLPAGTARQGGTAWACRVPTRADPA